MRRQHTARAGQPKRFGEIVYPYHGTRRGPDELFEDVLQLAHVAWPAMALQRLQGLIREPDAALALRDDVVDEGADVFAAIPQRWNVKMDDVEPIHQVFAELPG